MDKLFFQETTPDHINLFRFLYCSALLYFIGTSYSTTSLESIYNTERFSPLPLFEAMGLGLIDLQSLLHLYKALLISLLFSALGIFTRVSLSISWISFFFFAGTLLGFTERPDSNYFIHSQNIIVFILFFLSVSPGISHWNISGFLRKKQVSPLLIPNWPVQIIILALALAYFGAGYCKVINSFLWADGYTLQGYLFEKYLVLDNNLNVFLAQQYILCLLLSIGILVLELTFFVILFWPRLTWYYVIPGLMFHLFIFLTMNLNFLDRFALVYLIFVKTTFFDWLHQELKDIFSRKQSTPTKDNSELPSSPSPSEQVDKQINKPIEKKEPAEKQPKQESVKHPTLINKQKSKFFILSVFGVLLYCIIGRVESWPFTDYQIFQHRTNYTKQANVLRFLGQSKEGKQGWITKSILGESIISMNIRVASYLKHYKKGGKNLLEELMAKIAKRASLKSPGKYKRIFLFRRRVIKDSSGKFHIKEQALEAKKVPKQAPSIKSQKK